MSNIGNNSFNFDFGLFDLNDFDFGTQNSFKPIDFKPLDLKLPTPRTDVFANTPTFNTFSLANVYTANNLPLFNTIGGADSTQKFTPRGVDFKFESLFELPELPLLSDLFGERTPLSTISAEQLSGALRIGYSGDVEQRSEGAQQRPEQREVLIASGLSGNDTVSDITGTSSSTVQLPSAMLIADNRRSAGGVDLPEVVTVNGQYGFLYTFNAEVKRAPASGLGPISALQNLWSDLSALTRGDPLPSAPSSNQLFGAALTIQKDVMVQDIGGGTYQVFVPSTEAGGRAIANANTLAVTKERPVSTNGVFNSGYREQTSINNTAAGFALVQGVLDVLDARTAVRGSGTPRGRAAGLRPDLLPNNQRRFTPERVTVSQTGMSGGDNERIVPIRTGDRPTQNVDGTPTRIDTATQRSTIPPKGNTTVQQTDVTRQTTSGIVASENLSVGGRTVPLQVYREGNRTVVTATIDGKEYRVPGATGIDKSTYDTVRNTPIAVNERPMKLDNGASVRIQETETVGGVRTYSARYTQGGKDYNVQLPGASDYNAASQTANILGSGRANMTLPGISNRISERPLTLDNGTSVRIQQQLKPDGEASYSARYTIGGREYNVQLPGASGYSSAGDIANTLTSGSTNQMLPGITTRDGLRPLTVDDSKVGIRETRLPNGQTTYTLVQGDKTTPLTGATGYSSAADMARNILKPDNATARTDVPANTGERKVTTTPQQTTPTDKTKPITGQATESTRGGNQVSTLETTPTRFSIYNPGYKPWESDSALSPGDRSVIGQVYQEYKNGGGQLDAVGFWDTVQASDDSVGAMRSNPVQRFFSGRNNRFMTPDPGPIVTTRTTIEDTPAIGAADYPWGNAVQWTNVYDVQGKNGAGQSTYGRTSGTERLTEIYYQLEAQNKLPQSIMQLPRDERQAAWSEGLQYDAQGGDLIKVAERPFRTVDKQGIPLAIDLREYYTDTNPVSGTRTRDEIALNRIQLEKKAQFLRLGDEIRFSTGGTGIIVETAVVRQEGGQPRTERREVVRAVGESVQVNLRWLIENKDTNPLAKRIFTIRTKSTAQQVDTPGFVPFIAKDEMPTNVQRDGTWKIGEFTQNFRPWPQESIENINVVEGRVYQMAIDVFSKYGGLNRNASGTQAAGELGLTMGTDQSVGSPDRPSTDPARHRGEVIPQRSGSGMRPSIQIAPAGSKLKVGDILDERTFSLADQMAFVRGGGQARIEGTPTWALVQYFPGLLLPGGHDPNLPILQEPTLRPVINSFATEEGQHISRTSRDQSAAGRRIQYGLSGLGLTGTVIALANTAYLNIFPPDLRTQLATAVNPYNPEQVQQRLAKLDEIAPNAPPPSSAVEVYRTLGSEKINLLDVSEGFKLADSLLELRFDKLAGVISTPPGADQSSNANGSVPGGYGRSVTPQVAEFNEIANRRIDNLSVQLTLLTKERTQLTNFIVKEAANNRFIFGSESDYFNVIPNVVNPVGVGVPGPVIDRLNSTTEKIDQVRAKMTTLSESIRNVADDAYVANKQSITQSIDTTPLDTAIEGVIKSQEEQQKIIRTLVLEGKLPKEQADFIKP